MLGLGLIFCSPFSGFFPCSHENIAAPRGQPGEELDLPWGWAPGAHFWADVACSKGSPRGRVALAVWEDQSRFALLAQEKSVGVAGDREASSPWKEQRPPIFMWMGLRCFSPKQMLAWDVDIPFPMFSRTDKPTKEETLAILRKAVICSVGGVELKRKSCRS